MGPAMHEEDWGRVTMRRALDPAFERRIAFHEGSHAIMARALGLW